MSKLKNQITTIIVDEMDLELTREFRSAARAADKIIALTTPLYVPETTTVDRVAEAIKTADKVSWKHDREHGTQTLECAEWSDMDDDTLHVPYEGISLGRDHYRALAAAALGAINQTEHNENEIRLRDDDHVSTGGVHTSGKNVRILLDWFFSFGRPIDETLERLEDHLRRYPMEPARDWLKRKGRI